MEYDPAVISRIALLAGLVTLTAGCMDMSGLSGERPISTHAADWRDDVVYQLMVDRFADADLSNDYRVDNTALARYQGGDWRGVEEHLDYLKGLGVTAIWISPIVKNVETDADVDGYHGYWAQDFTQLNPHFGNIADLRHMIDAAHDHGIKVILDIVVNHLGQLFYYDINMNGKPDERVAGNGSTSDVSHVNEYDPDYDPRGVQAVTSLGEAGPAPIRFVYDPATNHMPPEPDIFQQARAYHRRGRVYDWTDAEQVEKGDFPGGLKDINTEDPDVRQALIDIFVRWVELTDLDGFRIDTLKHVDHPFWQEFGKQVRQRLAAEGKKDFFMFGESFDGDDQLDGSYTFNGEVDSVFYFPQHFSVFRDVFQNGAPTQQIQDLFDKRLGATPLYNPAPIEGGIGVPPNKALVNFIDNHDVARFLFNRPDPAALDNALLFLFSEDGIPCVYYGTEQGFSGGNDPANREVLWNSGFDTSNEHYKWIARLAKIRSSYPALTKGDLKITWASDRNGDEPDAGIIAFERSGGDAGQSYVLAVINTNAKHASSPSYNGAPMQVSVAPGTKLVDVLHPNNPPVVVDPNGGLSPSVPPTSGVLLVPDRDVVSGL